MNYKFCFAFKRNANGSTSEKQKDSMEIKSQRKILLRKIVHKNQRLPIFIKGADSVFCKELLFYFMAFSPYFAKAPTHRPPYIKGTKTFCCLPKSF